MEMIYAALLLHSLKQPINEEKVKNVLAAAGASADEAKIKALVASLDGVDIDEAISKAVVQPAPQAAAPEKKEEKKEEDIEKKAEQAAEGLSALFG